VISAGTIAWGRSILKSHSILPQPPGSTCDERANKMVIVT